MKQFLHRRLGLPQILQRGRGGARRGAPPVAAAVCVRAPAAAARRRPGEAARGLRWQGGGGGGQRDLRHPAGVRYRLADRQALHHSRRGSEECRNCGGLAARRVPERAAGCSAAHHTRLLQARRCLAELWRRRQSAQLPQKAAAGASAAPATAAVAAAVTGAAAAGPVAAAVWRVCRGPGRSRKGDGLRADGVRRRGAPSRRRRRGVGSRLDAQPGRRRPGVPGPAAPAVPGRRGSRLPADALQRRHAAAAPGRCVRVLAGTRRGCAASGRGARKARCPAAGVVRRQGGEPIAQGQARSTFRVSTQVGPRVGNDVPGLPQRQLRKLGSQQVRQPLAAHDGAALPVSKPGERASGLLPPACRPAQAASQRHQRVAGVDAVFGHERRPAITAQPPSRSAQVGRRHEAVAVAVQQHHEVARAAGASVLADSVARQRLELRPIQDAVAVCIIRRKEVAKCLAPALQQPPDPAQKLGRPSGHAARAGCQLAACQAPAIVDVHSRRRKLVGVWPLHRSVPAGQPVLALRRAPSGRARRRASHCWSCPRAVRECSFCGYCFTPLSNSSLL
ncbi:MAG: hypothetical protein J3K34DRAFT_411973 [Monoraphidium minutum]|nr:MAG: hypothetical protein J3K34DRAFT_411973 [Monoraphidium minutum]